MGRGEETAPAADAEAAAAEVQTVNTAVPVQAALAPENEVPAGGTRAGADAHATVRGPGNGADSKSDAERKKTSLAAANTGARAWLVRPTDFGPLTEELKRKLALAATLDEAALRAELEQRAGGGDAEAALTLGLVLRYGEGAGDKAAGEKFIAAAAETGNARAMAELGRILLADETRADGPAQADAWLRKAWAAGESEAAFLLASAQRLGLLEPPTGENATMLLWTAAERGNESARWLISDQYLRGELKVRDGDQVRRWLDALAEGGDLSSMVGAANVRLRDGDVAGALPWLERAVVAGSDDGCAILIGLLGRGMVGREGQVAVEHFLRTRLADPDSVSSAVRWELARLLAPRATEAEARAELLRLLAAAGSAQHYRAGVALRLIEQGRVPTAALGVAQDMSEADAFAMYSALWAGLETGEGSRAPLLLHSVMPVFPAELAASRQAGDVMLRIVVGLDGRVGEVEVMSSAHPALSAAAIEAARQWVFAPAAVDGHEVPTEVRLRLRFRERE